MNPFASLQNDTVYIENTSGERSVSYKTAIGSKNGLSATIFEKSLDVFWIKKVGKNDTKHDFS